MKKSLPSLLTIFALACLDQAIKWAVLRWIAPKGHVPLLDGIVSLDYATNTGAMGSAFAGYTTALALFTGTAILAGLLWLQLGKRQPPLLRFGATFIISGGIGNLIDRIMRGHVVDYIHWQLFTTGIFNLADILVVCGMILTIIYLLHSMIMNTTKASINKK